MFLSNLLIIILSRLSVIIRIKAKFVIYIKIIQNRSVNVHVRKLLFLLIFKTL